MVLIIPKWLNLTPGPIAILFGTFLELPNKSTKSGPSDPVFITKILQTNTRQFMGRSLKHIIFHIWESEILKILKGLCTWFPQVSFLCFFCILSFGDFYILKCWILRSFNILKCCDFETCNFEMCLLEPRAPHRLYDYLQPICRCSCKTSEAR